MKPEHSAAAEPAAPPSAPVTAPTPPSEPPRPTTVSLSQFAAYTNQMPTIISPGERRADTLITIWNLDVHGSEPVVVEQAVLSVQSDPPITLRIEVDAPRVEPKGGTVSVQQRAKAYEGQRFAAGTDPCRDKPKTVLTLTVRIGSQVKTLTAQGEYFCVS